VLSGHSEFVTIVSPDGVTNLNPKEALMMSSRSFGMLVDSIVRVNGNSMVTGSGTRSFVSPAWNS
jgi:hypothetical protein